MYRIVSGLALIGAFLIVMGKDITLAANPSVTLPEADLSGKLPLEQCLVKRRSIRDYSTKALTLRHVSQLLWAAGGRNPANGRLTIPSAGALYPLEIYIASSNIEDLPHGIYSYSPSLHRLIPKVEGNQLPVLAKAALGQTYVAEAAAVIIITAVYERTTGKYGRRGLRYAAIEVGHAAQNVYLQAASLNLGTVFVGAFRDDQVSDILGLAAGEQPLALLPVGRVKD